MPTRRGRQRWTSALPAAQPSSAILSALTTTVDPARDAYPAARLVLGREVLLVGPSSADDGFGGWRAGLGLWLAAGGFEVKGSGAAPNAVRDAPLNGHSRRLTRPSACHQPQLTGLPAASPRRSTRAAA